MKEGKAIISLLITVIAAGLSLSAQDTSMYKIKILPISSRVYNDMTPVILGDSIIFCSDRRYYGWKNDATFDGRKLYSIYMAAKKDSVEYGDVKVFSKDIQTLADEGPFCFTPDGNQIYFTRSIDVGKRSRRKSSANNNNGIFIADKSGDGWANIRPFEYNDPLWQTAHPCISPDGRYLFFASNTPGGEGMSDIYVCEWVDGKWADPVNLGPGFNSPKADLYPWISDTGELFFASDRDGGNGGLDIYSSRRNRGQWSKPFPLPSPINSAFNDFAYISEASSAVGFFTSDREMNDNIYQLTSLIVRKSNCDSLVYDSFCYEFFEIKAMNLDSLTFEFEWDFDDGSKARGVTAIHCYDKPGTYLVKLNLVDMITGEIEENATSEFVYARRTEQAFITSADTVMAGEATELNAVQTNLPGWDISEYSWNFDDGNIARGLNVYNTWSVPGIYSVQLVVKSNPDNDGIPGETCVSKIIVVNEPE